MNGFENFNEKLPSKEMFYSLFTDKKKVNDKEYQQVFKVWDRFEIKTIKGYTDNVMFYC